MSYYLYIHNIYLYQYQYHDTKSNPINVDWLLWLTPIDNNTKLCKPIIFLGVHCYAFTIGFVHTL